MSSNGVNPPNSAVIHLDSLSEMLPIPPHSLFVLTFSCLLCSDTFKSCYAAKQAEQIKCHVKQKQARKTPLAVWLTRLNKPLAVQIIHVNGTENETLDLQCI